MREMLASSSYFAIILTILAFFVGFTAQQRFKIALFNPILVGSFIVIPLLLVLGIPNANYQSGVAPLQLLLTPATICFAVPFYTHIKELKKHLPAVCVGVAAGTVANLAFIWVVAHLFNLSDVMLYSLLPKSVTTAIGLALTEEAGGIVGLTTVAIFITGILGNVIGPALCKLFHLTDPVAQGVGFGTSAHAVGTSRALEMSELAGAVSSFSLTLAGLLTTVLYSFLIS